MWPTAADEYQSVESNLRETMKFFGRAQGSVEEHEGVLMVTSGTDYGVFNAALLSEPVDSLDQGEFEARAHTAAQFFRDHRNVRWSFWICDDLVAPSVRRRVPIILEAIGLQKLTEAPGMSAGALAPPQRPLPDLEIRAVQDEKSRNDFLGLTAVCFDLPIGVCQDIYGPEAAWNGSYQGYVGYQHGEPVSAAAAVAHGGAVGIYSLGTPPQFRGRGFGETLLRHAVAEQGRAHDIHKTILQATRAGFKLYHRLGYRKVTHFSIYLAR